jgi:hypothetical protein
MTERQRKIVNLLELITNYELETCENFGLLTIAELANIYNGAGPDWMPKWGREATTAFLKLFEAAFLIHDVEFHYSDKLRPTFNAANKRMWLNMRKIINALFPWWNPFTWVDRTRWWTRAYIAYKACDLGGWGAWIDGSTQTIKE